MPNSWSGSRLDLHIDLDAAGGRRSALESALRAAIHQGRLSAGLLLPSTRGLAQELGLSRGTVTAAYDQLVEEGYLTTRPGSGTTVADVPPGVPAPALTASTPQLPVTTFAPGSPMSAPSPPEPGLPPPAGSSPTPDPRSSVPETPRAGSNCATHSPTTWAAPAA
ncbi:GntR family transcriptional regulator [Streptosporangium lutulentum]